MTPEAYLYQVLVPALMAVAETMVRAMTAASLVALLGGVLATAWKFRGSIAIAKPAFKYANGRLREHGTASG